MKNTIVQKLKDKQSFKIVFLGDSITSAEWVHPNWREIVEYVIKDELSEQMSDWKLPSWGIRCFNSGFDGSTTRDLLEKLDDHVLSYKPDMVIMMATSNDAILGINPESHTKNIQTILHKLTKHVDHVVYATDICSGKESYSALYSPYVTPVLKLFPMKNVQLLNMFDLYEKYDTSRFFTFISGGNPEAGIEPGEIDFIHPNSLGNAYIAKIFLERIFQIPFDPEKYISELRNGIMFPSY